MDVYQQILSVQHHGQVSRPCSRLSSGSWWRRRVALAAFADCGEGRARRRRRRRHANRARSPDLPSPTHQGPDTSQHQTIFRCHSHCDDDADQKDLLSCIHHPLAWSFPIARSAHRRITSRVKSATHGVYSGSSPHGTTKYSTTSGLRVATTE